MEDRALAELNWDVIELVAKQSYRSVCIGKSLEFNAVAKREMAQEARGRGLVIRLGNHDLNEDESDDELYINARGGT